MENLEYVILVDENDKELGVMEKIQAHREAKLHRAFSVFILNNNNELLLQRRALTKYHSPGLWTNTCCSHPRPNETSVDAAKRRLIEEMGISCELKELFSFIYKTAFENGLTEHEFDHVFIGHFNDSFTYNQNEVVETKWQSLNSIREELVHSPNKFTSWFKICFEEFLEKFDR